MKKFYTLAAALLATGSMLAVNPAAAVKPEVKMAGQQAEMSVEGAAMFRAEQAYLNYMGENGMEMPGAQKFTWTDPQGEVWTATVMENGAWEDNFTSWDGAKYYGKMQAMLDNGKTGASRKVINHVFFYPKYCMWNESGWSQLFPGETPVANKIVPLKYCMKGSDIMTANWPVGWCVPQASETANNFYIGGTSSTGGSEADALVIMNTNTKLSSGAAYFTQGSFGYAIYNGVQCGPNQGSIMQMANFDDETSSIDITFTGNCNNASGSMIWTYNYAFSGEANLFGLSSKPVVWKATNIHVVNTGSVKGTDPAYEDIDEDGWGPFQRFYLLATSEGYSYDQYDLASGGKMWTSTTMPEAPVRLSDNSSNMGNCRVALFSANGSDDIQNVWNAANLDVAFDAYQQPVTSGKVGVNTFLYGGWRTDYWPWSGTDGLKSTYKGWYWYLPYVENPSTTEKTFNPFIMIGTPAGFGVLGLSTFNCDYRIVGGVDNIVYHYDPTDYLKTRNVAAKGTVATPEAWNYKPIGDGVTAINGENNNVKVEAANGMINVTVENATVVNIYNMAGMIVKSVNAKAGQTVSVDAANGIYVVKAADKAVKVAL